MGIPLNVLIVEDSEDDAALLVRELQRSGYELTYDCVCTPGAMSNALERRPWDVVISDYGMPNFDGMAALELLKQTGSDIPFLLVSGTVGEDKAVAAMKAGASDYLVKGHLARLAPAVERELREAADRKQRKQAQHALQESEALFRSLCASSPVGVFQADAQGAFLYTNERCRSILGLAEGETLGARWAQAIHPEDRPAVLSAWASATETGSEFQCEHRILLPDGELRCAQSRAAPLRALTGEVTGFVGTLEDMTDSKHAQDQIRHQFERLSALRAIDVAILSSLDLRHTLEVILDQVVVLIGVHAADCLLLNPQSQLLVFSGGRGLPETDTTPPPLRRWEGHAGRALLEQRPVYVALDTDTPLSATEMYRASRENFVAYYAIPLIANGEPQGVLELYHREQLSLDGEWLEFLETLAGQAAIAILNATLIENIRGSHAELAIAYDATLEGWVKALDLRDHETEGHTRRVTEMTVRLASMVGMSEDDLVHIRRGALLHDIGKIGIPDHILLKPGKLTDEEWVFMKMHPIYAHEWLAPVSYLAPCLDIPYCHHEKWDGSGYPRGLVGEEIPLAARVFAVVDVWDALSSDRPYRKGWSPAQVHAHILSLSGTHFDPAIVEAFRDLLVQFAESAAPHDLKVA